MPRPARKPAPPRRTPRQARGKATVDAILEAAARILRTRGPAALTTNRVSEVAGVGVGTLYGYFPDKTAILVALARRLLAEDEAAMLAALAEAPGQEPLRVIVRTLLDRHCADAAVRRAVMSVHHAQGLAAEHSQLAQRTIARLLDQAGGALSAADPARLFVLTRALLGVARAVIEETPPPGPDLEDELVRLAHLCLAD
jgi:AcrR family transcriptional regulator